MGFLRWMENRTKFQKLLLCFIGGWRAYAIVRAVFEHRDFKYEIVFGVFAGLFSFLDFVRILFKGLPWGIEDYEACKVVEA